MKYKVVVADTSETLVQEVTKAIDEGWQLQGGIGLSESNYYSEDHKGYSNDNFSITFAQALVRFD